MSAKSGLIIAADAWGEDDFGGAFKIATEFAIHCARGGREVHYLCSSAGEPKKGAAENRHGLTIWRYRRSRAAGSASALHFIRHMAGIGKIFGQMPKKTKYVLNGHTHLPYLGILRIGGTQISRRVMSVHSPLAAEYAANRASARPDLKSFAAALAFKNIEKFCYGKSDVVQCFSEFTASRLRDDFPKQVSGRLSVCPGYVRCEDFEISLSRLEARQKLPHAAWKTDDVCFFSLRRHAVRMGLDNLIHAFSRVKSRAGANGSPKSRLILAGSGPMTASLRELAVSLGLGEDVRFIGNLAEEEKALHYRAADCFVLPTRELEGFGLIILEAFAAGIPVIATPVGAIPEVLGAFAEESLTASAGPEDIGEAMTAFLLKPRDDGSRELARRRYAGQFDKAVILPRLESLVMGERS